MIRIRPATPTDLPDILKINNFEILNSTINYDFEAKTLEEQTQWFEGKLQAGFPVIVATSDELVAGFATFGSFRPKPGYRFTAEHSVYLGVDYRGKGIGTLLLLELIEIAKTAGYHTLVGGIDSTNEGSYRFHQKLGFREVARFREIGHKFEQWLDLIFMQLILRPED